MKIKQLDNMFKLKNKSDEVVGENSQDLKVLKVVGNTKKLFVNNIPTLNEEAKVETIKAWTLIFIDVMQNSQNFMIRYIIIQLLVMEVERELPTKNSEGRLDPERGLLKCSKQQLQNSSAIREGLEMMLEFVCSSLM